MPAKTIWTIVAIGLGLPLSAAGVILMVAATDLPAIAGLAILAAVDLAIIVGGYVAVRRSLSSTPRG